MSIITRIRQVLALSQGESQYNSGYSMVYRDQELLFLNEQLRIYSSQVRLRGKYFDNFTGETAEMRIAARRAFAEPAVKAALLGKVYAVMRLPLQVIARDPTDPNQQRVAEFCADLLNLSEGGVPAIIWNVLCHALIDGFSVCEPLNVRYTTGRWLGKIGLLKTKAKQINNIQFEVDNYKNVTGIFNMIGNSAVRYNPDDFIVFSHLKMFESPNGISDLRASYRATEMILYLLKLRMIFLDKFSGPFIHAKHGDIGYRSMLLEELKNSRGQGVLVTDVGADVKIVDLAMSGTSDFQAAIDDLRKEVAIGISGAFLHMLTGGKTDERGNSEVQQSTVDLFIWALSVQVASVIQNQLLPDYIHVNFGVNAEIPIIKLDTPNPVYMLKDLEIDKLLFEMNYPLSKRDLSKRTGRPIATDPDDLLTISPNQGTGIVQGPNLNRTP